MSMEQLKIQYFRSLVKVFVQLRFVFDLLLFKSNNHKSKLYKHLNQRSKILNLKLFHRHKRLAQEMSGLRLSQFKSMLIGSKFSTRHTDLRMYLKQEFTQISLRRWTFAIKTYKLNQFARTNLSCLSKVESLSTNQSGLVSWWTPHQSDQVSWSKMCNQSDKV
jgi:hypothetical protein